MDLKIAGICWKYLQLALETDLQRGGGHIFFQQVWSQASSQARPEINVPKVTFTITMILHSAFCYYIDLYKHRCTMHQAIPGSKSQVLFHPSFSSFSRQSLKTWSWRKTSSLGYSEFGVKTWKTWSRGWKKSHDSTAEVSSFQCFNGLLCETKSGFHPTNACVFQLLFALRFQYPILPVNRFTQ